MDLLRRFCSPCISSSKTESHCLQQTVTLLTLLRSGNRNFNGLHGVALRLLPLAAVCPLVTGHPLLGWHAHPLAVPGGTARVLTLHLPLDSTISQVTMDGKALRYALKLPSQRYALWRGAGPLTGPFASTRLNVISTRIGKVVCRNLATPFEATG